MGRTEPYRGMSAYTDMSNSFLRRPLLSRVAQNELHFLCPKSVICLLQPTCNKLATWLQVAKKCRNISKLCLTLCVRLGKIPTVEINRNGESRLKGINMIYDKIKTLCNAEGITIKALEQELGMGNGTIGKWKKSSPTVDLLKKVANRFHVSIAEFFDED